MSNPHTTTLLISSLPPNSTFGIDLHTYTTGPNFRGIKYVPPGLHFVYYARSPGVPGGLGAQGQVSPDVSGGMGLRDGFWVEARGGGEVIVREWDAESDELRVAEALTSTTVDERGLAPYPYREPGIEGEERQPSTDDFKRLSTRITKELLDRILPTGWGVGSTTASISDEKELKTGAASTPDEHVLRFSVIDLKRSWPPGSVGADITRWSLDKSWVLNSTIQTYHSGDRTALLGELQLAYLCLLAVSNFAGWEAWKTIVEMVCDAQEAIATESWQAFFVEFMDVIEAQLVCTPEATFRDIVEDSLFLATQLRHLRRNITDGEASTATPGVVPSSVLSARLDDLLKALKEAFDYEIELVGGPHAGRGFVDLENGGEVIVIGEGAEDEMEEETGEYAPVIVEM
ncbi:AAR2-domain-containing protein [Saitoella complicata NRRL Y-17804]|uniref:Uncharacterized protein n=1 Tax=Saitoella complicata (strain BCRC 22490 / CBS 7301 / JCM 7358 / NBRC 10748 / NRRL Y-17804) TaxID=698492 RepID=A0A0E9NAY9_SAICN|nr:AAR2-domain-containing protein [Saitoella complicata NRRL Y-17804]ODQ53925.1 AAR2-domain-containing protein [Saitoella complicata NRRL Y-17804]GAO46861.1 hypothetical protein G7K_1079-t1 [Saitoella complicata NRRL Y-17804]